MLNTWHRRPADGPIAHMCLKNTAATPVPHRLAGFFRGMVVKVPQTIHNEHDATRQQRFRECQDDSMKDFATDPFLAGISLQRDQITTWERYPYNIPAVRHLRHIELHPQVTFFVGENGTGKSTLVEALAVELGFNPEGGSRNFNFATRDSHSLLHQQLLIDRGRGVRRPRDGYFFRAESYFNVATELERLDEGFERIPKLTPYYGGKSLHEQSHGESFWALMTKRFHGNGLYIFDEPEAALSPMRQMSLLTVLHDLAAQGSQFIIATHSPIIMAYPQAWIYWFSDDGIKRVTYEETEHFKVTQAFMNKRGKILDVLLEGEEKQQQTPRKH